MNQSFFRKNLGNILSLLALFISIPSVARADLWGGFLINYPPVFFVLIFFGIWIIEAVYIFKKLQGNSRKALLVSFLANIFTTGLGVIIASVLGKNDDAYIFNYLIPSFIISVAIEFLFLKFVYKDESIKKLFGVNFSMNLISYTFIVVYVIAEFSLILLPVALLFIPIYFSIKFVNLMFPAISAGSWKSNLLKISLFIFLIFCAWIFLRLGGDNYLSSKNRIGSSRARDARRVADLRQVQNGLELYFSKNNQYPLVNNWVNLKDALIGADVGIRNIPQDPKNNSLDPVTPTYMYATNVHGDSYILKAIFEDRESKLLDNDVDGNVFGVDCEDGDGKNYYCVKL